MIAKFLECVEGVAGSCFIQWTEIACNLFISCNKKPFELNFAQLIINLHVYFIESL